MNYLLYIGVGIFVISTAVSEGDVPQEDTVRVPRALVLKPIVKVKTHHEEDEGPFDFIADWISNLMNPHKPTTPAPLRLLVPGGTGVNNELYIEHMTPSPHSKSSFVIIRLSADANNQAYNPGPTTPYHPKPIFPSGSTRYMPKPSGNFYPISPTVPSWSRPSTMMDRPLTPNHYNMHMNNHGYDYNYQNHGQYNQRNYPNNKNFIPMKFGPNGHNYKVPFNPYLQQSYRSHDRFPHNPYGTHDFHNSIPGASGGNFHGMDSFRPANYPSYSSFPGAHNHNNSSLHTMGSEQVKVTLENVDLPIPSSTTLSSSSEQIKLNQVNRLDRMISTTSHLNHYSKQPAEVSVNVTTEMPDDTHDDKDFKYSSQEIQEISAPKLHQNWENIEENEDQHVMKINKDDEQDDEDKATEKSRRAIQDSIENNLMKARISDMIKKRNRKSTSSRRLFLNTSTTTNYSRDKKKAQDKFFNRVSSSTESNFSDLIDEDNNFNVENITLRSIENVMNLTASGSWKNRDNRRPDKLLERYKNNNNRKVRIVESVKSSVSMIKSKGKAKVK